MTENQPVDLLDLLWRRFEAEGYTRDQIAQIAGVSPTAISQYRSSSPAAGRTPSYNVVSRLFHFAQTQGFLKVDLEGAVGEGQAEALRRPFQMTKRTFEHQAVRAAICSDGEGHARVVLDDDHRVREGIQLRPHTGGKPAAVELATTTNVQVRPFNVALLLEPILRDPKSQHASVIDTMAETLPFRIEEHGQLIFTPDARSPFDSERIEASAKGQVAAFNLSGAARYQTGHGLKQGVPDAWEGAGTDIASVGRVSFQVNDLVLPANLEVPIWLCVTWEVMTHLGSFEIVDSSAAKQPDASSEDEAKHENAHRFPLLKYSEHTERLESHSGPIPDFWRDKPENPIQTSKGVHGELSGIHVALASVDPLGFTHLPCSVGAFLAGHYEIDTLPFETKVPVLLCEHNHANVEVLGTKPAPISRGFPPLTVVSTKLMLPKVPLEVSRDWENLELTITHKMRYAREV